jgi:hypothetical protein
MLTYFAATSGLPVVRLVLLLHSLPRSVLLVFRQRRLEKILQRLLVTGYAMSLGLHEEHNLMLSGV